MRGGEGVPERRVRGAMTMRWWCLALWSIACLCTACLPPRVGGDNDTKTGEDVVEPPADVTATDVASDTAPVMSAMPIRLPFNCSGFVILPSSRT